jgi:uncharacterized protein
MVACAVIARSRFVESVRQPLSRSRVVCLLGPRQCGKTTVGRQLLAANPPDYFDLEDPASLARLDEPMTKLRALKDLIVIDEVQRRPELFPVLRVLADRGPLPARFLILAVPRRPCCVSPRNRSRAALPSFR